MINKRLVMKIIVNLITTFRCLFVFYLAFLFGKIKNILFLIIASLLFLTDFIDGLLARKYKVQTNYGATMDTIADKMLSIVLIIIIINKVKYLYLILLSEIIIALINIYANIQHKQTKSSYIGKIKMWILSITIILSYAYYFNYINITSIIVSIILTFITQVYVIVDYIIFLKKEKRSNQSSKIKNIKELLYRLFSTKYYLELRKQK